MYASILNGIYVYKVSSNVAGDCGISDVYIMVKGAAERTQILN